jgi:SHS2 domain-containing protein
VKTGNPGYRLLEHPSDVGLEVTGRSLKEVFEFAALGLTSVIVDPDSVEAKENRAVGIREADRERLLVQWLSEILYLFDGENFVISSVVVSLVGDGILEATLRGEQLDMGKHRLRTDVKAITYHQLCVKESSDGILARVFFDL